MTKAVKLVDGVEAIEVMDGEPPLEIQGRGHISVKQERLITKARELEPGQWFEWPSPPASWRAFAKKYLAAIETVRVFRAPGGRVIISHKLRKLVQRPESSSTPAPAGTTHQVSVVAVSPSAAFNVSSLGKDARAVLIKLRALDMPITKSDLLGAMGLSVLPNDAIDKLVAEGLIKLGERHKDGRKTLELTEDGKRAALACVGK